MNAERIRIGLLGCGTVGGGLVRLVTQNRDRIARRSGVDLEIARILVRNPTRRRVEIDHAKITTRPGEVLDAGCDVVVEVIGGVDTAGHLVRRAIASGASVVTANKALLAAWGSELAARAAERGVRLEFEASVCGAVPVVRALRESLASDTIHRLSGVLNGTSNFILTLMEEEAMSFDEALARAQALGFAEADPSLDVDGHDAMQKLMILASLAFDAEPGRVIVEGIRDVGRNDVSRATDRGEVVRHVATAEITGGVLTLTAAPTTLPRSHPLASVRLENNAVVVEAAAAGTLFFAGKGAGALPTASAVLADVVQIARKIARDRAAPKAS